MRKIYNIICLCIAIVFLQNIFIINKNVYEEVNAYSTSAKSMIVIEADSNRVLVSNNEFAERANASTTKIVTFLTVLKNCKDVNQVVNVDNRAIGIPGTSIYLKKGESLTVKELLYGMMLVSGNDAATALALHISKTVEDFAKLMTDEAKKCGALNSNFKNPHGLDEKGHFTTAYDLAQITRECYKYPLFEEIVTTKNIKIPDSSRDGYRYLKNKNKLLWTFDGANGVKTGFTNNAGRCLVSSAKRNDMHLICVVLSCGPMFEESMQLLEECFNKYYIKNILEENSYIKSVGVENSDMEQVKVYTKKGFNYPITQEEENKLKIYINIENELKAPLEKDQIVGDIKIYLDKHLLFYEKIYTMESVKSNRIVDNINCIISNW